MLTELIKRVWLLSYLVPDSSVKTSPMEDLEMALLSGRGYTGTMLVTSGDPGCILTPFMIQLRRAGGDEGPA